jgi:hypothetical protein
MPKITQNRVYNQDGSTYRLDGTSDNIVQFLNKFNALRYVQATENVTDDSGNVVYVTKTNAKGKEVKIPTKRPAFNADGSPKMIARPRSGYTQYFNNDGPTNPISPEALSPQGIGKMMAKMTECAHRIIAAGGKKADEMKLILDGLTAYNAIATTEVAKATDSTAMEEALAVLKKTSNGDAAVASAKLGEFLASKGIDAPAPTMIDPPAVTVAETVAASSEVIEASEDVANEAVEADAVDTVLTVEQTA